LANRTKKKKKGAWYCADGLLLGRRALAHENTPGAVEDARPQTGPVTQQPAHKLHFPLFFYVLHNPDFVFVVFLVLITICEEKEGKHKKIISSSFLASLLHFDHA
jgi:hypothetical protein